ncbi:hypothetical protein MS2017_1635 [Bathymodiolus thermophilus thioautotrophic gill symbiont]|uniref:Uncharacterized protein n=1 Tax=Bathymodiolus thermophilus thioautotrophic gill symbiont TaxID=2360 RepID=A0A3G3IN83_9GAMM|nr:hypothetical protein MS2017_1635 [Bathymodiolus thermophilus thioautotrophic gill symbiont]
MSITDELSLALFKDILGKFVIEKVGVFKKESKRTSEEIFIRDLCINMDD